MGMDDDEKEAMLNFMRSTAQLSATVKNLAATVDSLGSTLLATQDELAGLRLVSQAAFGALGDTQEGSALFPAALARVMEADTSHMLTTTVSDEAQERRRAWMLRLLPPETLRVLRLQNPQLHVPRQQQEPPERP